jgi:hypothetical protein
MCKYIHVEAELYHHIMNTQKNGFAVSMEILQYKGCRLAKKHNTSISEIKVIYGGVWHFMAKHNLTIR